MVSLMLSSAGGGIGPLVFVWPDGLRFACIYRSHRNVALLFWRGVLQEEARRELETNHNRFFGKVRSGYALLERSHTMPVKSLNLA